MADNSPATVARELAMGFRGSQLLFVMAELGIADQLAGGPLDSSDLATRLNAAPDALHRVLRALAQFGVLEYGADGCFALTSVGDCLRSDRPDSLRPVARFWGHEMFQRSWGNLLHTVVTGETAFNHIFGMPAFDYLERHPDASAIYNPGMAKLQASTTPAIAAAYDFGAFDTIIDVGGGNGSLLAGILQAHPGPRGIVFDLPHARAEAEETLQRAGLAERACFKAGDFFDAVPTGGDCHILRQVIHDWNDKKAEAILLRCREALPASGCR